MALTAPTADQQTPRPAFTHGGLAGKVSRPSNEVADLKRAFFDEHVERIAE